MAVVELLGGAAIWEGIRKPLVRIAERFDNVGKPVVAVIDRVASDTIKGAERIWEGKDRTGYGRVSVVLVCIGTSFQVSTHPLIKFSGSVLITIAVAGTYFTQKLNEEIERREREIQEKEDEIANIKRTHMSGADFQEMRKLMVEQSCLTQANQQVLFAMLQHGIPSGEVDRVRREMPLSLEQSIGAEVQTQASIRS